MAIKKMDEMARQVQVLLIDDIDQTPAERNVAFSLEGENYEIDLSQGNIDKLHAALEPFVKNARKVRGARRRGAARRGGSGGGGGNRSAMIREWAREQGMQVSARGRVAAEIVEAYEAAH